MTAPLIVGWKESCALPELGIVDLPVKVDTGARTSALHVISAARITPSDGPPRIRFEADLTGTGTQTYEAAAAESRMVRSSNGEVEERLAIRTRLVLGGMNRAVDITLTNRNDMRFPMLVGRTSLRRGVLVNPLQSFLVSRRVEPGGPTEPEDADISEHEVGDD